LIKSLKELKPNQIITLVNKGIRKSDYSARVWIDSFMLGRISFIRITKVGTKYIYGKWLYPSHDIKEAYYVTREDFNQYVIYDGIRQDLKDKYIQFENQRRIYEEKRKKAIYNIDHEVYKIKNAKIESWDNDNPRPENPFQELAPKIGD